METSRDELTRLLEEQAALRRVATLVARGIHPVEIFSAVAEEIRRLLGADNAGIGRFEPDGTSVVVVGGVGEDPVKMPVGTRVELHDYLAPAAVWRTGRARRLADADRRSRGRDPTADRAGPPRRDTAAPRLSRPRASPRAVHGACLAA